MAPALDSLRPLLGEWSIAVDLPGAGDMRGRMVIEPLLGGAFLAQRSEAPDPAPDGFCVIAPAAAGESFTQHYFDSRGVVRLYEMSFENDVWTLRREKPDFSDFSFSQRFTGTLSEDGRTIEGRWERTGESGEWITDFELTYSKID